MSAFPHHVQFPAPPMPNCAGQSVGCAVLSTYNLLEFLGWPGGKPTTAGLADSMGQRHRKADPDNQHGICPSRWCPYCAYLELKARGVAVAYGKLTVAQVRAHADAGHPMVLGVLYGEFTKVAPGSYGVNTPARGRSDAYVGLHGIVVWKRERKPDGTFVYVLSDSDFGSAARPRIPPHSEIAGAVFERAYRPDLGVAYLITAPKPKPIVPGVNFRFEGYPAKSILRSKWEARGTATVRKGPRLLPTNVTRTLRDGELFEVAQVTYAGDRIGKTHQWLGSAAGSNWVHRSQLRRAT